MVDDSGAERDAAIASPARTLAAIAVLGLVVGLAVLPILVGFGMAPGAVVRVVAGLGSLVAVLGGVKLAAVAWGLMARFSASPGHGVAAASVD